LQEHSKEQTLDLEDIRDRILASLKLGKQAPEYRRSKALLDKFITSLDQEL
jgi:hypothetical protein